MFPPANGTVVKFGRELSDRSTKHDCWIIIVFFHRGLYLDNSVFDQTNIKFRSISNFFFPFYPAYSYGIVSECGGMACANFQCRSPRNLGANLAVTVAFLIGFVPDLFVGALVAKFPWIRLRRVTEESKTLQEELPLDMVLESTRL